MSNNPRTDVDLGIEDLIPIAQAAGQLVVRMRQEGLSDIQTKSTALDLVTEADVASERLLREALQDLDPSIGFWGEESNVRPSEDYFWLVDPIDGTVNYAKGIPAYAINIALNRGEETLLGLTLALPSGELFWAKQGEGAYKRTTGGETVRLQVNDDSLLEDAMVATGFPYHRAEHPDNNSVEFAQLMPRCRGVRRIGSAAIDLAYVAAGIFAGYWEGWLEPWDAASGILLVQEAGGRVTTYSGRPHRLGDRSLIASNGQPGVHQALVDNILEARSRLRQKKLDV